MNPTVNTVQIIIYGVQYLEVGTFKVQPEIVHLLPLYYKRFLWKHKVTIDVGLHVNITCFRCSNSIRCRGK